MQPTKRVRVVTGADDVRGHTHAQPPVVCKVDQVQVRDQPQAGQRTFLDLGHLEKQVTAPAIRHTSPADTVFRTRGRAANAGPGKTRAGAMSGEGTGGLVARDAQDGLDLPRLKGIKRRAAAEL